MDILEHGPRKLTYDDYVLIPEDGLRHEIVDGVHVVNPAPNQPHQRIVGFVYYQLIDRIEHTGRGCVMLSPFDVRLGEHDIVQPDVLAIALGDERKLKHQYVEGAPTLAVEVLSPSTARLDRGPKLAAYDRAGVEEYWIIDPRLRKAERWSRHAVDDREGAKAAASGAGPSTSAQRGLQPDGDFEDELPSRSFPGVSISLEDTWRHMAFGRPDAG